MLFPVAFVGIAFLVVRPTVGAIIIGAAAASMVLSSLPFVLVDLAHPESFWNFVPSGFGVIGALVGLVALVGALRRFTPRSVLVLAAGGVVAMVAVVAIASVATDGFEDDERQPDDFGIFTQDTEFEPAAIPAPAGDVGFYIGNDDLIRHNITIDEFDIDEELPSKAFVRVAFTAEPGTDVFYCDISGHEDVQGTLTVS